MNPDLYLYFACGHLKRTILDHKEILFPQDKIIPLCFAKLLSGLFRLWISELTGTDIRDLNDASCKMINIVGYSASDLSVWLIIAVTFER